MRGRIEMAAALDGIRVLDLSSSVAAAWCSRLLADFGAEVIVVEPPAGHPLRARPPVDTRGRGLVAEYVLANMRSVVADRAEGGAARVAELAARADVVVEDLEGTLAAWGIPAERLLEERRDLLVLSLTPHGLTGGRAGRAGCDLTAAAIAGWASINGLADREPLKGSGLTMSYLAGVAAYGAVASALLERERSGLGQRIDVAEAEVVLEVFAAALLRSEYQGAPFERRPAIDVVNTFPVPAADGHFSIMFPPNERMRDALLALGLQQMADDERFANPALVARHRRAFSEPIEAVMRTQTRAELLETTSTLRVIGGPVITLDELVSHEQLRERGYFVRPPGASGSVEYPGAPARLSATPWELRRPAPATGADDEIALPAAERGPAGRKGRPARSATAGAQSLGSSAPPLAGIRAVVLTHAWLGTFCTQLLGFMGADVIQVEARKRPDSWRGGYAGVIPPALKSLESAEHAWNCGPLFNAVNLNKRGVTLDLADPEGRELFLRLVAGADVVAENYSPRVVHQLGVDYESLRAVRPDLVMISLSAYGASGPWRDVLGIGGTVEPTSGMSSLLGYRDGPPLNSGQMLPDPVGGWYGFDALVTALIHRERTGEGQYIDLSMQEANATLIGDALLEYSATGRVRPRLGNRDPAMAPHGVYPAAGEDRWIAIAAGDDAQWRAICAVAGREDWAADPRFATLEARHANEDELDALMGKWTSGEERETLATRLAAAGVMAEPVHDAFEVIDDPVFREREAIVRVAHPEAGEWWQVGTPYRYSRTRTAVTRHSPCLGEHSEEILRDELGLASERIAALAERGVTGEGPPPA